MEFFVMRHGEAEPALDKPDESRRLTLQGGEKVRQNLLTALQLGAEIDCVLTSPLTRARETAQLCVQVLHPRLFTQLIVENSLAPSGTPGEFYPSLLSRKKESTPPMESVLVISHQPLVSLFVSSLLGIYDGHEKIAMKPGSIAKIHLEGDPGIGKGTLLWLVSSPDGGRKPYPFRKALEKLDANMQTEKVASCLK